MLCVQGGDEPAEVEEKWRAGFCFLSLAPQPDAGEGDRARGLSGQHLWPFSVGHHACGRAGSPHRQLLTMEHVSFNLATRLAYGSDSSTAIVSTLQAL